MLSEKKKLNTIVKIGISSAILSTVFSSVIISMLFNLYNDLKNMKSGSNGAQS